MEPPVGIGETCEAALAHTHGPSYAHAWCGIRSDTFFDKHKDLF